ncbi:MAG TPA: D-alanyl-D-alanine carboxypeptidase/D-alanyl-D-alanine-endopeptidase [Solirubrobacterales bacterium]|nr:D-alanyl-D-alanine carboxypeptidase/D-alanyl-D-alanine-endopeptidase [Solirubrobacterales bacterium]
MRRTPASFAAICALLALLLISAAAQAATGGQLCASLRARLVHGGGSASGLLVIDGETGTPVCARAAGRQRPLASNMKLFTTSTALSRLGPESRITTRLETDGEVDPHGVLHGSLYLVGGGDPALGIPAFYRRFLGGLGTNLFLLKRQVREAGISAVTGRVYADDSIFDRLRGVADSGYATSPEIGPLSGLSFNSGYSSAAGGSFAADPAETAAATLAQSLRSAGVRVSTSVALATAPPASTELAKVESPPLTEIINTTDVYSDNFFAEMLIKLLGARFGGAGTTAAGARVVEQFAGAHGSGVHAVDGSGLTRSGRASPAQIVGLLRAMRGTPAGEELIQDMALAGHEGTVADRMHGTAAYGRCRTKTGTLTGVSNLSGYCFNRDGKVMIFSILMAGVRDLYLAHYEQDLIAGEVASY